MNQIKKLELVGFKSFFDRTHIPFHEGITAIIGPNGCGKSNVSDAISWVVGAQNSKVRAGKMEDVIFNGTEKRKATNFAEVLLTLSLDTAVEVPGFPDLNRDNFTVGRRLYRSGQSEYYLDGRHCRLRDLQALFEGTGLGPNSYAILEQGRVGQILSDKPAERRSLIEEAARITTFRNRRIAAETQLERAQQNLLRVSDMEAVVAREMNSLHRQADKTRKYGLLRNELRAVQKLKIGLEERALRAKLSECSERFRLAGEREQEVSRELAAAEAARAKARGDCGVEEEAVNRLREQLSTLRMEAQNAKNTRENQEIQRQGQVRRAEELAREQASIAERGQAARREIERLRESSRALDEQVAREQMAVDEAQAKGDRQQEAIRETERQIDEIRSFLSRGVGDLAELRSQQARGQENLRRIAERSERLEREREAKAEENHARRAELESARRELEAKNVRREEAAVQSAELEAEIKRHGARIEEVSAELSAAEAEHGQMRHRFESLEEIERRRSNYSEGVQKYLAAKLPGEEGFQAKTLADLVEADPAYESALEDYLNSPLQYILVDSRDDAVSGVQRLRRIGAGKCTFMTLRGGSGAAATPAGARPQLRGDGVIGYLDELLHMNEDVKQAFERALPEYAATVMVNDLETAFRIAEQNSGGGSYLTLAGESYSPRGTLSAIGAAGEQKAMAGFLALKREKRELEKKLSQLKEKIESGRAELGESKRRQAAAAEELKVLAEEARELGTAVALAKQRIDHLERELDRVDQAVEAAVAELEQLAEERAGYERNLSEAAGRIAELETRRGASDEELRDTNARWQTLRAENAALGQELRGLAAALAASQERKSNVEADLARLHREADDARRRAEENQAEQAAAAERIRELEASQEEMLARIAEFEQNIAAATESLEEKEREFASLRTAASDAESQVDQIRSCRDEAFEARGKVEIEKTRLESDLGHLEQNCVELFQVPVAELLPDIPDEDWNRDYEEVSAEHERLRNKVENFGAVNMRALEDYQEREQEYQHLNGQRLDTEMSIKNIQAAISELNQRSSEKFREAYAAIRQNFQEVFQILFGGGQCDLQLLDENDVLESGINITAQPPGKKLQSLRLLSGGERALTALALLIAIFRYRPSPLCILDEVDAPLDEANVGRFARMLTELSRSTQFIIITHNKNTMEAADTAFGLTMEEPGVSKIIGVDFRRYEEQLAS